jgi:integrase
MTNGISLAEYIPEYRAKGMINLKPSTRKGLESSIRAHIIPMLGETALNKITTPAIQELLNSVMDRARSTRENVIDDLFRILKEARNGHDVPPLSKKDLKFGLLTPGEGKTSFLTPTQTIKVLRYFAGRPTWDAFFHTLALTGMRPEEILGLRIEDVDFEENRFNLTQGIWERQVVTLKTTASSRPLHVPPLLKEKLRAHIGERKSDLVFTNKYGRPLTVNKINERVLHPAFDALGIPHKGKRMGLYAFRHGIASWLAQKSLKLAQAQLRHTSPETTLGYVHVLEQDHTQTIDLLESVLLGK